MEKLSTAEMNYLLTIENQGESARLSDISKDLQVTKASVFGMLERLEKKGLVHKEKKVTLTEAGKKVVSEAHAILNWMKHHLVDKCGVPEEIANEDSIKVICSLSDVTREKAAEVFAKSGLYGNCNG